MFALVLYKMGLCIMHSAFRVFVLSLLFLALLCTAPFSAFAQGPKPTKDKAAPADTSRVRLLQAAKLRGDKTSGQEIRYVSRDSLKRVVFEHESTRLFCDSAIHYADSNWIEAFGNILIEEGDSITLTGDSLYYYGDTKIAEVRGKEVILTDKHVVLTTNYIDYNLRKNIARYLYGGRVEDTTNVLTSRRGYYNTKTKVVSFKKDVVLDNPSSGYHLETDSLTYYTKQRLGRFDNYAVINSKDGRITANRGEYNAKTHISKFYESAFLDNDKASLEGNYIEYEEESQVGVALGNVRFFSKKDSFSIYGEQAIYQRLINFGRVVGKAVFEKPLSNGDTLFLVADTLAAVNDTIAKQQRIDAYRDVKFFTKEIKGICDSLVYDGVDSLLYFFYDPVLWSNNSQLTADSIKIKMKKGTVDKLFMSMRSFVVSTDSFNNYNQVSGRNMLASFVEGKIKRIDVDGNAISNYFVLNEVNRLVGMNHSECSNMFLLFNDSNRIAKISFLQMPSNKMTPPKMLKESDRFLKGFSWREKETPLKDSVLAGYRLRNPSMELMKGARLMVDDRLKIYMNLQDSSLIVFKRQASLSDLADTLSVDFFPKDLKALPSSLQKQRFETKTLRIPNSAFANGIVYYEIPFPSYPIYAIRVGQYRSEWDGQKAKKQFVWEHVFNVAEEKQEVKRAPKRNYEYNKKLLDFKRGKYNEHNGKNQPKKDPNSDVIEPRIKTGPVIRLPK